MLTNKQVKEIKVHLEKAQNPLFFFDNDQDGLCSFLLLQRSIERGKGVAVKYELDTTYFRRINELSADYIFIVDVPVVSDEFWKEVEQINIPVVWIDHHKVEVKIPDFVNHYNPIYNKVKTNEPTSALCYQVTQKKEDLWIATVGSVSDKFLPDFYPEFKKEYPDLSYDSQDAFDIYYKSGIGKVAKLMGAGLKDKISNVVLMCKFLMKAKSPYDVLEESKANYSMHDKFNNFNKKYQKLMEKAIEVSTEYEKVLFFQYGGDTSMSSELSNELSYRFPSKYVIVVYHNGIKANISGRGKKIRDKLLKAIEGLEGSRGGGHENAVGAQIRVEDIEIFRKRIIDLVK